MYVFANPQCAADHSITLGLTSFAGDAQIAVVDGKLSVKGSGVSEMSLTLKPGETRLVHSFNVMIDLTGGNASSAKPLRAYVLLSIPTMVRVCPGHPY